MTTSDIQREQSDLGLPDVEPEQIDDSFVPLLGSWNVATRFDDELLVVDSRSGQMNLLNPTATMIYECFDGEVSIGELAAELAEAFHSPLELIRADVVGVTREFAQRFMLVGVSPALPEGTATPMSLQVGQALPPLQVADGDGAGVTVPRPGARGTLLVNWSPFCGYCGNITEDLSECLAGLGERGIDVVLLTIGSAGDNLPMLEGTDLTGTLRYRVAPSGPAADADGAPTDPFGVMGTPAAILVDAGGKVAEPLVMGALAVPELARRAAGLPSPASDATIDHDLEGGSPAAPRRNVLPAASGMCAPVRAGTPKRTRQWGPISAYAIGEFTVGVRADSARTDDLVGRAFARYRIADDQAAPANYSMVLGASSRERTELSLLLLGDTTVLRTRSPRRLMRALSAHLSALLDTEETGLLRTRNPAVLAAGRAVLLPPSARYVLEHLQPRLARLGVQFSDEPYSKIDPVSRELVVPEPTVAADEEALAALGDLGSSRGEQPAVPVGRYGLAAWVFDDDRIDREAVPSRAAVVAGVLPAVIALEERLGEVVDPLGHVLEMVPSQPMRALGHDEIGKAVEGVLRSLGLVES